MRTPPLKVYLALSEIRGEEATEGLYNLAGATDYLFSFAMGEKILQEIGPVFDRHAQEFCIIIDSGAFSAWNRGAEIDIEAYAKFCHRIRERWNFKELYAVNLDVIPGKKGEGLGKDLALWPKVIRESAEGGSRNAAFLRSEGLDIIEVFHQGEEEEFLHRMISNSEHPYIGVSPANDVSPQGRAVWLDQAFNTIRKDYGDRVRTHGFGVTGIDLMWAYPWTSVDSASYKINAGYGGIVIWDDSHAKLTCISVGAKCGEMHKMRAFWEDKRRMLPPFVKGPEDLESVMTRSYINGWAYLQARDYINEHYKEQPRQTGLEELLG